MVCEICKGNGGWGIPTTSNLYAKDSRDDVIVTNCAGSPSKLQLWVHHYFGIPLASPILYTLNVFI